MWKIYVSAMTLATLGAPQVYAAQQSSTPVAKIKAAVKVDFKDPASAQFREIKLVDSSHASKPGEGVYCGEVNAKNSYGGYVGFMPFMVAVVGTDAVVIKVASDDDEAGIVRKMCTDAKNGKYK